MYLRCDSFRLSGASLDKDFRFIRYSEDQTFCDGAKENLRAVLDHVYTLDEAKIANLYDQTRHLIRLVTDLRELAVAEAHQLPLDEEPTNVNTLVDETLRVFAPLAEEKHVRLAQHLEQLPLITMDTRRMRQVLDNLLSNALHHTPPENVVTVLARAETDRVYIAVQDTGGTGLGLAFVKAIVEAHGGSVAAHSDGMSRGTTFSFVLPR